MFAEHEVTLACMLVMHIKVCDCVCSHIPHACVKAGVLYLAQGAFLHSDVSQQDD